MKQLKVVITLLTAILAVQPCLDARTRKGDKYLSQGRDRELRKDWDGALELYELALSEDPGDAGYLLAARRVRFQAGQAHVEKALKLRDQGSLNEALAELQKAYAIDPSSSAAEQEIRRTQQMIEREKKKATSEAAPAERGLSPSEQAKRQTEEKIASMLPMPELQPLNPQPINLKMNNQPPKVLYETVGKMAGVNVLFDPEYQPVKSQSVELSNATLEEALDYLSVITKSFWKALSANTIFVANDNTTKRRDYEEQVMRVFYLSNVNTPQELQEIVTAVRSVADIQRLFVYNAQNAIIARGEADRIALAEKIIYDLDKPKSEVVVDVLVMEANSAYTRKLAAAISPGGLTVPINYNPRASVSSGTTTPSTGTGDITGTGTGGTTTGPRQIPLNNLGKIATADYSVVLPDGLLQALMNDRSTKVLQSPQLRSVDNQKASLRIGDKQPTATGSFQPGIGGVGINPLVNTQFTFIDVGVNVDLVPRVHDNGEISLHVEVEISNVRDRINLGGIDQPVIGQRRVIHDIRMREGEVNLLGGLMQHQETKTVAGIPGLSSIPVVRRLFTTEAIDRADSELLIVLVPHIVRRPEITEENLRGVAVGNATVVKLNYDRRRGVPAPEGAKPPSPGAGLVTPPAAETPAAPVPAVPPIPGVTTPPTAVPPPVQPAPAAPAAAPRVTFIPSAVNTSAGSTLSVSLLVENAQNLHGAGALQIRFDPKVVRMTDVTAGNLLASDGQPVIFTKNILNDEGTATINLSRMPNAAGITGTGALLTMTFQAIAPAPAPSAITIPNLTLRDAQGGTLATVTPTLPLTVK